MDLFDASVAKKAGKCLSDYLFQMEAGDHDVKRREELQAVVRDRSLNKVERAKKMEELKQKYLDKPGDSGNKKASVDLSAQAASVKHLSELRSVQAGGQPQPKESIYNELGELKQWGTDASKMATDSESKCVDVSTKKYAALIGYDAGSQRSEYYDNTFQKKPPSIESQRREELQAIMQDKTLGKVERGKKSKLKRCFTNGVLLTMILTALHNI